MRLLRLMRTVAVAVVLAVLVQVASSRPLSATPEGYGCDADAQSIGSNCAYAGSFMLIDYYCKTPAEGCTTCCEASGQSCAGWTDYEEQSGRCAA